MWFLVGLASLVSFVAGFAAAVWITESTAADGRRLSDLTSERNMWRAKWKDGGQSGSITAGELHMPCADRDLWQEFLQDRQGRDAAA